MRADTLPLAQIKKLPRNAKLHSLSAIHASIDRFGYLSRVIINETTGRMISGHGRCEDLDAREAAGEEPPGGIEANGKDWLVPVDYVSVDPDEENAAAIALNRLTETGGWETQTLADLLTDLAARDGDDDPFRGIGYSAADLEAMLAELTPPIPPDAPEPQTDRAEELRVQWGVEPGQVWQVGRHRVMCGDSTKPEDVERLLDGAKPFLMVTDPPYGVEYDANWRNEAAADGVLAFAERRTRKVTNDDRVDWSDAYKLFPGDVAYTWSPDTGGHSIFTGQAIQKAGFVIRNQIIWVKPHFPISRGHYTPQHEICWYAVRKNNDADWIGPANESTTWHIALDKNVEGGHSTQKPLECMARPIRNHNGDVYDPFLGSGTTLVVCEQLNRIGYGCEIDPAYVGVILQRLSDMGLTPELS